LYRCWAGWPDEGHRTDPPPRGAGAVGVSARAASPWLQPSAAGLIHRLAVLLIAVTLAGCGAGGLAPVDSRDGYGPAPPGYYRIRRGDTLSEIAERRRVRMATLAGWNNLRPPYAIYVGDLLRVKPPDGKSQPSGAVSSRRTASQSPPRAVRTSARTPAAVSGADAASSGIRWVWPAQGPVKQGFRDGDRTRQGVRIAVQEGAAVNAAADGTVVYSGSGLKGYGNLIIVKHNARYLSAYGFNRELIAREGDRVKRGERVAVAGRSANGEGLLHFEIRQNGVAVDPLRFLPSSR
jgi:lipoprotein NlpD